VDHFVVRDLSPTALVFVTRPVILKVAFAVLIDYHLLDQDPVNRAQVGPQASRIDVRAARVVFMGRFNFKRPWLYMFAADYHEDRKPGDKVFDILDFHLTIPIRKKARIVFGKQKEPFIYEMVGDAANLPQQERLANAFFVSRNIGIRYLDNYLNDRISFSVGVYNDWFRSGLKFRESGFQVSGRLTGLLYQSKDERTYLHAGFGVRYTGGDKDQLRFRARPEVNIVDYYADTGNFDASHAKELALETLYNRGPFSVLAEYVNAWVASPSTGNPTFNASYITGSYVLTGENRPYDKSVGYARRIIPRSRWGAVEVVGRYGHVDLDAPQIKGGTLNTWYSGLNWWASRQWKFGIGYGLADLDRFDVSGRTKRMITRVQWVY
jgi:hypothetical protein